MNTERDEKICQAYLAGKSIYEIKREFNISHERARQIIKRAGIYRGPKPAGVGLVNGVVESTERDAFLGVNLTDADKVALRTLATERGISMSALTSEMIHDMLETLNGREKN